MQGAGWRGTTVANLLSLIPIADDLAVILSSGDIENGRAWLGLVGVGVPDVGSRENESSLPPGDREIAGERNAGANGVPSRVVKSESFASSSLRASLPSGVFFLLSEMTGGFTQSPEGLRLPHPESEGGGLGTDFGFLSAISNILIFTFSLSLLQASLSAACQSCKGAMGRDSSRADPPYGCVSNRNLIVDKLLHVELSKVQRSAPSLRKEA